MLENWPGLSRLEAIHNLVARMGVARLVIDGLQNKEIADRLFISPASSLFTPSL